MNKKLLAAALGVVFAAPVFADSSSLTLYGRVHTVINHADDDEVVAGGNRATMEDVSSRIGVDVKEDLGGGLKLIAGYEFGVDNSNNGGINSGRNGTIGFDGSFGKVQFGRQDGGRGTVAPMYNMGQGFVGGLANNGGPQNQVSGGGDNFTAESDISSVSGVGNAATVITGSQRVSNATSYAGKFGGLSVDVRHATVGTNNVTTGANSENSSRQTEIGLGYSVAGFKIGFAAYDADTSDSNPQGAAVIENSYLLGVSYDVGALNLALAFQQNDFAGTVNGEDKDNNVAISATYKLGGGSTIYGMYADGERNGITILGTAGGADMQQAQLMYAYDFSKRTRTYVGVKRVSFDFNAVGAADQDLTNVTVGLRHNF